ncbi:MAG: elongation factor G [SAR202 cluster bacterium]|nr:elongation factor G [SAR202 cluster bacterium]
MAKHDTDQLRNVVLLSHSGAGKTILSDALLLNSKVTTRLGRVEDGTTTSDYEEEEHKRQASVQTSVIPVPWKDSKINLLDTPGYADYRGEVVSGFRAADGAILMVSAPAGVEVGTIQMWQMAQDQNIPRILVINKLDRENADFDQVLETIVESFGRECVPVQLPIGSETDFKEVVNLLDPNAKVPDNLTDQAEEARERIIEAAAESDDELAEKYLEGEDLTQDEIIRGLRKGVIEGTFFPVLSTSATTGVGISELADAILGLLPSPAEVPQQVAKAKAGEGDNVDLSPDSSGQLAAQVFKTTADPFVGKLSYFKVFSGTLKSDSQIWNSEKREAERTGTVYIMRGKEQEPIDELAAGDIGAVAKLNSALTGDTLAVKDNPLTLPNLEFPSPVYQMSVFPKTQADVDKLTTAIGRIAEEDPSLQISREPDTNELLMGGLGDVHVEVAVEKMKRKFGVEVELMTPKVPYKETIASQTNSHYRHKKQSGGHGQFAEVYLELEPLPRGSGFEFDQRVVGGAVPREYIPSVQKGCEKALVEGVLAGFPLVDVKATLYDGSFHPVDSSGVSFEIAGSNALSGGVNNASPQLLEPIMHVQITVPDTDTGDVMGDLNSKRARILGMNPEGNGYTTVEAEAPQAEMLRYATDLRSQTQGRGWFTLKFDHYDPVPGHLVDKVVQEQKDLDEAKA